MNLMLDLTKPIPSKESAAPITVNAHGITEVDIGELLSNPTVQADIQKVKEMFGASPAEPQFTARERAAFRDGFFAGTDWEVIH